MELDSIPNSLMCRLCLGTSAYMINIFSSDHNYLSLITDFTGLEITECPDLPHLLCKNCIEKLTMLVEFKTDVCRTQALLHEQEKIEILIIAEEEEPEIKYVTDTEEATKIEILSNSTKRRSLRNLPQPKIKSVSPEKETIFNLEDDVALVEEVKTKLGSEITYLANKKAPEVKTFNNGVKHRSSRNRPQPKIKGVISPEKKTIYNLKNEADPIEANANKVQTATKEKKTKTNSSQMLVACHLCGKQYPNSRLKYHLNSHNNIKPFICKIDKCEKAFPSPYQLKSHQKICHTDIYPYTCDICGRKFKVKTTMKIHKSYHLDPELPCLLCGKLFRNVRSLRKHNMSHTGERPYPCSLCPKSFQNRYTLRIHQRVHTGEKNFVCAKCGKSFGYNCLLKNHISKKHPESINES